MYSPRRRAESLRKAHKDNDVEASAILHNRILIEKTAQETHKTEHGDYIKSIIFSGLDGLLSMFAIVAAIAGSNNLPIGSIFIIGFSNLIADALSMASGDFISESGEIEYQTSEFNREQWEFEHFPIGEITEMIEIYMKKGFARKDAETIIHIMSKNKDFFIEHMVVQELGILPPDKDAKPAKQGLITFISFVLFGCIPIISFIILSTSGTTAITQLTVSGLITGIALFILGFISGGLVGLAGKKRLLYALKVLLSGFIAGASAYLISFLVESSLKN